MVELLIKAVLVLLYGAAAFLAGMYYKEKVLAAEKKLAEGMSNIRIGPKQP